MRVTNIDTSTIEGKIEVMQRAAKGEKVAYRYRTTDIIYNEVAKTPLWGWHNHDYQIILPEPREFWLFKDDNEQTLKVIHGNKPSARWDTLIHVREVLPNERGDK